MTGPRKPRKPIVRRTRLAARTPMKRGTKRIRPKKRKPSEFARIYGSKERVAWINNLSCANCGRFRELSGWRRMVNAHTENGGTSRKADADTIVPLCETLEGRGCHDVQHDHGWSSLSNLDTREKRKNAAASIAARWLAHQARNTA